MLMLADSPLSKSGQTLLKNDSDEAILTSIGSWLQSAAQL